VCRVLVTRIQSRAQRSRPAPICRLDAEVSSATPALSVAINGWLSPRELSFFSPDTCSPASLESTDHAKASLPSRPPVWPVANTPETIVAVSIRMLAFAAGLLDCEKIISKTEFDISPSRGGATGEMQIKCGPCAQIRQKAYEGIGGSVSAVGIGISCSWAESVCQWVWDSWVVVLITRTLHGLRGNKNAGYLQTGQMIYWPAAHAAG